MALSPGTHLGPYEITGALGAGGMGEVYRASDSRLGREVAIKILPQVFASNAERMARFGREAQMLAALNHASIAPVYGLEENDGARALVMELVEGPTLAERIAQGPVPLDDALRIGNQIAEALEYAHERGIIHRDLKPANVKVTPEGNVKILDFGLAKALEDSPASANINTSPTISMAATQSGLILGTAAYMSPEQARGKMVDRRTDIWAFGAVLYEMLSRKQAFQGEDTSQIMAAVIMKDPEWAQLPADLPNSIRNLVQRCLTKNPTLRLQAIGEARITLDRVLSGAKEETATAAGAQQPMWRQAFPWSVAGILAIAFGMYLWAPWKGAQAVPEPMRLSVELGADTSLFSGPGTALALSLDGKMLAFTARAATGGVSQLYLRRLDQTQATAVAGSDGARDPFFSPDGKWVAFFNAGSTAHLMKVSVNGGAVITLCEAEQARGGSWGDDGNIVIASANGGLQRVSSEGGTPTDLTKPDATAGESSHRWPQVLPGAKAVLFTAQTKPTSSLDANVVAFSLQSRQRKVVRRGGTYGRFLPDANGYTGYLLYVQEGNLFAARFDADRMEMTGEPVPVVEGVSEVEPTGSGQFAVSANGTLVYLPGRNRLGTFQIDWVNQQGKAQSLTKQAGLYTNIMLSPDGQRVALDVLAGGTEDIWVYEAQREAMSRLTFGPGSSSNPVWTPDGLRIAYAAARGKPGSYIYWQRVDGTGESQKLTEGNFPQVPWS
jgi:serine/threonine-protein kinase